MVAVCVGLELIRFFPGDDFFGDLASLVNLLGFGFWLVPSGDLQVQVQVHWSVCVAHSLVVGGVWEGRGGKSTS